MFRILLIKKDNKLFLHFCLCDNSTDRKNQQKLASVHCWLGLFGSANKFIVSARQQTIQTNERTKEGRCRNVTVNLQPTHASTIAIQRHTQIDVSFQDRSLNSGLEQVIQISRARLLCLKAIRAQFESNVNPTVSLTLICNNIKRSSSNLTQVISLLCAYNLILCFVKQY